MNQSEYEMTSFRKIAEAIDTTLLNGIALGEVQDYSVEIVPDDRAIVVKYVRKVAVDRIHMEFKLQAGRNVNGFVESNDEEES